VRRRKRYDWEDDLREDRAYAREVGWSAGRWAVTIIIGTIILSGLLYTLKIVTADARGRGDQHLIVNDGRNRVNAQEAFHDLYNEITSLDDRIEVTAEQLAGTTTAEDRRYLQQTLEGQMSRCLEVIGRYNAQSDQVTRARWRDATLPYKIDKTDPETDCKLTRTAPTPR